MHYLREGAVKGTARSPGLGYVRGRRGGGVSRAWVRQGYRCRNMRGSHSVLSHASSGRQSFICVPVSCLCYVSSKSSFAHGCLHHPLVLIWTSDCSMSSTCCFCRILDTPADLMHHLLKRHVLGAHASQHVKTVMYPFSMISPPKIAETGIPRLSAMGGRAGCNPDSPLRLTTKCRLPAA